MCRSRRSARLPVARYTDVTPEAGPWEVACAQQGLNGWTEVTGVDERPADETVARELGLQPGATVIRRGNRMRIGDQVAQLQQAWLPLSLFAGTPLAASKKIRVGIYRGLAVVHVHIVVSADRVSLAYRQLL